jgi:translation initiation factor 1
VAEGRLVYSTSDGDQRKKPASAARVDDTPRDGVVRVFREKGGRGGKIVTVVRGLPGRELAATASDLKKHCGCGGAVKDGAVEIQGDHREKVAARLKTKGHTVKLAGG